MKVPPFSVVFFTTASRFSSLSHMKGRIGMKAVPVMTPASATFSMAANLLSIAGRLGSNLSRYPLEAWCAMLQTTQAHVFSFIAFMRSRSFKSRGDFSLISTGKPSWRQISNIFLESLNLASAG